MLEPEEEASDGFRLSTFFLTGFELPACFSIPKSLAVTDFLSRLVLALTGALAMEAVVWSS